MRHSRAALLVLAAASQPPLFLFFRRPASQRMQAAGRPPLPACPDDVEPDPDAIVCGNVTVSAWPAHESESGVGRRSGACFWGVSEAAQTDRWLLLSSPEEHRHLTGESPAMRG